LPSDQKYAQALVKERLLHGELALDLLLRTSWIVLILEDAVEL